MKKLVLVLVFAFAACGGSSTPKVQLPRWRINGEWKQSDVVLYANACDAKFPSGSTCKCFLNVLPGMYTFRKYEALRGPELDALSAHLIKLCHVH